jgi:pyrimidine operon attenuation protein/uracil phosphoribosyltransferase
MRTHYDTADLDRLTASLASSIAADCVPGKPLTVVGIRTRGHVLADRLAGRLAGTAVGPVGRGVLDITLYRDDLSEIGPRPVVRPTRMDTDIDGKPLILVDDVLFTGRTVRAALNALADFGRPSVIRLAVLVDRGGRELPIHADFTGVTQIDVPLSHRVKVKLVETDGVDEIVIEPRTGK